MSTTIVKFYKILKSSENHFSYIGLHYVYTKDGCNTTRTNKDFLQRQTKKNNFTPAIDIFPFLYAWI